MFKTLCHATPTFNEMQHMVPLPLPSEVATVLLRATDRHGHFERFHEPSVTERDCSTYYMDLIVEGQACDKIRVPCALTRRGDIWELKVPIERVVDAATACAIAMAQQVTCIVQVPF